MTKKRILVADADLNVASQFAEALGERWTVKSAATGTAALDALDDAPFDAVVASFTLPKLDGPHLLNRVREKFPDTVRFLLAAEGEREQVMKDGLGTQQFLTKPCDPAILRTTLENAVSLDRWIADDALRELVSRMRSLPTIPSIYLEVRAELKAPAASPASIGAIISKDMAMTTKLLQVCNSSYFGLPRKITDAGEAVGLLGFDSVNSIVVAVKMLGYYDRIKPAYYSVDRLWRHSLSVAQHARELAVKKTGDRTMAETSYTAGLMHDLGKIVLACNFCQEYELAQNTARQQGRPLWVVEKETFAASHAEIGAYLLGLWGLPPEVSEAAALHHQPLRSSSAEFTVLTAVHVANALEDEINPPDDGLVPATLDTIYLARIDCLADLEGWRQEIKGDSPAPAEVAAAPVAITPAPAPEVKAAPAKPAQPSRLAAFFQWIASFWRPQGKPSA